MFVCSGDSNTKLLNVPTVAEQLPAETGSQTWEQQFTGEEDQETDSQTWEKQFAADEDEDDEDEVDDDDKKLETGSQT